MSKKITPVHYKVLVKILKKFGLTIQRITGDHIIMSKPGMKRPAVIQTKSSIAVPHIINNLKEASITRKEYLNALGRL